MDECRSFPPPPKPPQRKDAVGEIFVDGGGKKVPIRRCRKGGDDRKTGELQEEANSEFSEIGQ